MCWCAVLHLRSVHMLSHLVFTPAFGNAIYYPYFTEKEIGSEGLINNLPRVI